jgi:hypothetical protein
MDGTPHQGRLIPPSRAPHRNPRIREALQVAVSLLIPRHRLRLKKGHSAENDLGDVAVRKPRIRMSSRTSREPRPYTQFGKKHLPPQLPGQGVGFHVDHPGSPPNLANTATDGSPCTTPLSLSLCWALRGTVGTGPRRIAGPLRVRVRGLGVRWRRNGIPRIH